MRRMLIGVVAGAMLLGACGGSDASEGVATLDDTTTTTAVESDRVSDNEQAVLTFTACLRENGLEVRDPRMDENGNVDIESFLEVATEVDPEDAEVAVEACSDLLDDIELGFDQIDLTGLQDTLIEFSACMRDNGYDLPDPDFSNLATLQGDGPFGPIDLNDPAFEAALEQCDEILAGINLTGE
ncbi:MAG TPA: hypothetical protein VLG28_03245 [Acidimicrobiia bacterium]|nr:hypothetical protein [Acidimicrobiia bacterium]